MNLLTHELLWPLLAVFLLAGLVKGVTGMGLPTVAMGLLGSLLSPLVAAALLLIPSVVTNLWQALVGPGLVPLLRRFWPLLLGILLGTLPGSLLLTRVDAAWSGLALGLVLMAYAAYALVSPRLQVAPRLELWLSPVIGLITGLITGATGVFVIPAVPWLQALRLEKDELVQALGLCFTCSTLALMLGLFWHDALQVEQLGWSLLAVVPALIGMGLGQWVRQRISPALFRLIFLSLLLLLGLQLALRPFV